MRCKKCGYSNKEASKFCAQCGCEVLAKQNKKKSFIVLIISLVFIIGIGLMLALFFLNNNSKNIVSMDMPDNPTETDEYFWENSIVVDVIDVAESEDVLTESEVSMVLEERGFLYYPITYKYTIDGDYTGKTEIQSDSNEKHPVYQTFYMSDSGDVWTIYVVNGSVIAYPVSINISSDLDAQILYADSNQLISYAEEGNKFYVTVPFEETIILKEIDIIDATELNKISSEVNVND